MSKFLDVALKAISVAEKITLSSYHKRPRARLKSDNTPVTAADRTAEREIAAIIREAFPEHGILGEEFGRKGGRSVEFMWLIDPIDGTKNFVGQIPLWGNLLALWHEGEMILGVSNMPMMGERLWAHKGHGAFLNGKRVRVSSTSRLDQSMISYGSLGSFKQIGMEPRIVELIQTCKRQRAFGDLWPYHLLACGKLDIVIEAAIKSVDVAPFVCIIREAGGATCDLQGNPFDFGISSFVATNGRLHQAVMRRMSS
ncbi:MAG: inositol monophosphatase family protein [Candidatus Zixiibacteriota bacterium]